MAALGPEHWSARGDYLTPESGERKQVGLGAGVLRRGRRKMRSKSAKKSPITMGSVRQSGTALSWKFSCRLHVREWT